MGKKAHWLQITPVGHHNILEDESSFPRPTGSRLRFLLLVGSFLDEAIRAVVNNPLDRIHVVLNLGGLTEEWKKNDGEEGYQRTRLDAFERGRMSVDLPSDHTELLSQRDADSE